MAHKRKVSLIPDKVIRKFIEKHKERFENKVKSMEEISQKAIPILKKYGIKKAGVFGSFARGDFDDESDVDILIDPPDDFSLFDLARLSIDLEDTLGRKVDIVTYRSIYEPIKNEILKEQVILYE